MNEYDAGPGDDRAADEDCSFVVMAGEEIESVEHSENEGGSSHVRHRVTASGRFSEYAEGTLVIRGIDERGYVVAKNSTPVNDFAFELSIETDERWHEILVVWYEFE